MSTNRIPIIRLYRNLIVPIHVALTDQLIIDLKEDLAEKIQEVGPHGVIVDVSGIDVLDSFISRAIRDMALISNLMGVKTVICGIDPMMAMALVEMGMGLAGVRTELNLEGAIEHLDAQLEQDERVLALE